MTTSNTTRSRVMKGAWFLLKKHNAFNPLKSNEGKVEINFSYALKVSWAHEKNEEAEVTISEGRKLIVSVVSVPFTYMKKTFYNHELHLTEATKVLTWRRFEDVAA